MLKETIGIIGYGVVGKAAVNTFSKAFHIIKYDKYQDLDQFEDLSASDFIFIMVPTPFDCLEGGVDDSAVTESLEKLQSLKVKVPVIIKSTVVPGSCREYKKKYELAYVL